MCQCYRIAARGALARGALSRGLWVLAIALGMAAWGGCATWKEEPETSLPRGGLPAVRVSDEVTILEIAFVRLPDLSQDVSGESSDIESTAGDSQRSEDSPAVVRKAFWEDLDAAIVPVEMRSRLAENGIRAARLLSIEPGDFGDESGVDESTRLMEEANVVSDFEHRGRRISCREGHPYTLAVRRPAGENAATLVRTSDGIVGHTLRDPQFMLILRTRTLDDGRIAVRMTPEIQHGEVQQNFVSSDLAFRMEFQREQWTLDELKCEVPLSEGQAMVMMPVDEPFGLGQQMFVGRRADQSQERIAVVVRLVRRPQHRIGS